MLNEKRTKKGGGKGEKKRKVREKGRLEKCRELKRGERVKGKCRKVKRGKRKEGKCMEVKVEQGTGSEGKSRE